MACIIHKWNGCRCEKCGKIRDKEHDWNGCKCRKCGQTRNEGHDFIYRSKWREVSGTKKDWCEGECRICRKFIYIEHDDQPTDKKCLVRCARCNREIEMHDFQPIPGRCAEICHICGEERDYMKIAMNEAVPKDRRINAIKRLKEASMVPDALREKCEKGEHIWDVAKFNPQRFQGGTSSTEYVCVVCGKREVEMDYGD